jgi:hypothetical protein
MAIDEVRRRFRELSESQRIRVLTAFGINLTIVAVTPTWSVSSEYTRQNAPRDQRDPNRLLGHIFALVTQGDARYPDDVLPSVLLDHDDEQLRARTLWAFEDAINRHGAGP